MKTILMLLMVTSSALASERCFDPALALIPPCEDSNLQQFKYQGECPDGEIEMTYCASEEMINLKTVEGQVYSVLEMTDEIDFVDMEREHMAAPSGMVSVCAHSIILMGQSKAAMERSSQSGLGDGPYLAPEVLKFICIQKDAPEVSNEEELKAMDQQTAILLEGKIKAIQE